jgi:hypothetical protein
MFRLLWEERFIRAVLDPRLRNQWLESCRLDACISGQHSLKRLSYPREPRHYPGVPAQRSATRKPDR